jgi:hypothetical protein
MNRQVRLWMVVVVWLGSGAVACSGDDEKPAVAIEGTAVRMDFEGAIDTQETFYNFPYPSDLRLNAQGGPDLTGIPFRKENALISPLVEIAQKRPGFPVVAVSYFSFDAALAKRSETDVIAADKTSPILLIDVDESSPTRGALFPVVAYVLEEDAYVPAGSNLLGVAPRPGFVLVAGRKYAVVIKRGLKDAAGKPLGSPLALEKLKLGGAPDGSRGEAARSLYQPLWQTLEQIGVPLDEVAAATVFTTGDVVSELSKLSDKVLEAHGGASEIGLLRLDAKDGNHDRYCELHGKITLPQFQRGTAPFATEGQFELDAQGMPKKQGEVTVPVVITIPKQSMPSGGFPLAVYIHGSGGISTEAVDRGKWDGGPQEPTPGTGPASIYAELGIATATVAKPVNPERVSGATEIEYLNFSNLAAFPYTFRQGALEERLFIEALSKLTIDSSVLGACKVAGDPQKVTLDIRRLVLMGQSMGGMYTNMVAAIEPRVKAIVPTGAGGFWSLFMLKSTKIGEAVARTLVGTSRRLTLPHPALTILQTAWEPSEPMVYAPRVSLRPLKNHPARHIYQPVAPGDSYFPTEVYDAMALAYQHPQAGNQAWPSMQQVLKLSGLSGLVSYPTSLNRDSENGEKYTGLIVQYQGDGFSDPHAIAFQLDDVVKQYGCFVKTFLADGNAVVIDPRESCPK